MTRLLVASRNRKKLAELRRVLDGAGLSGLTLVSLSDVAPFDEAPETGATFEDNALAKARDAFAATGLATVADDSGLCIDALDGRPGVFSSRYAATDRERIQRVLNELDSVAAVAGSGIDGVDETEEPQVRGDSRHRRDCDFVSAVAVRAGVLDEVSQG